MNPDELAAFAETAARFAAGEVSPMLDGEQRDGNLADVPAILQKGLAAGLVASCDPRAPGYEYGVWGRASATEGPAASLAVLEKLAEQCAGVATCVHVAGLGAMESPDGAEPAAVAYFENTGRIAAADVIKPPAAVTQYYGGRLIGEKHFVSAAPGWKELMVFASAQGAWVPVRVMRGAKGLKEIPAGERMGLAACEIAHLEFGEVEGTPAEPRTPERFLSRHMLGLSAIALGNAQGALNEAGQYVAERYQGGGLIQVHAAIRIMLGDAESRVRAARRHLQSLAGESTLRDTFAAKLRITLDCAQAVTDCLQALGGYGFMEDYPLEKRLRDALALKIMAIRPDDLRMLCYEGEGMP